MYLHSRGKISRKDGNWTRWESVCPQPLCPHLGVTKGAQRKGLQVRWHVHKPRRCYHHHQAPEVIQSPGPLCVHVSDVALGFRNTRSPSAGCSHWIIQERLNALCSELTGTKPHLGRISRHKLCGKFGSCHMKMSLHARNCGGWGGSDNYHFGVRKCLRILYSNRLDLAGANPSGHLERRGTGHQPNTGSTAVPGEIPRHHAAQFT